MCLYFLKTESPAQSGAGLAKKETPNASERPTVPADLPRRIPRKIRQNNEADQADDASQHNQRAGMMTKLRNRRAHHEDERIGRLLREETRKERQKGEA